MKKFIASPSDPKFIKKNSNDFLMMWWYSPQIIHNCITHFLFSTVGQTCVAALEVLRWPTHACHAGRRSAQTWPVNPGGTRLTGEVSRYHLQVASTAKKTVRYAIYTSSLVRKLVSCVYIFLYTYVCIYIRIFKRQINRYIYNIQILDDINTVYLLLSSR